MKPAVSSVTPSAELTPEHSPERRLPSGRSVVVRVDGGKEELEVRSPQGEVEVRITLTDEGPVVNVRGARLELESPDVVAVRCRRLELNSSEGTQLASGGDVQITGQEVRVETKDDIHMKGKIIHLN